MKSLRVFLPAAAAFAILAGCGTSGSTTVDGPPAAEPMEFKLAVNKGDVFKYRFVMDMKGKQPGANGPENVELKIESTQTITVLDVADGKITFETEHTDAKGSGHEMASFVASMMSAQKTQMVVDEHGKVVEEQATESMPMSGGTVFLPVGKIKVGDTWTQEIDAPDGKKAEATYKFEGMEDVGGKEAARITMTPNSENLKGTLTTWIDPSTGMILKGEGTLTGEEGTDNEGTITLKMDRV